MINLMINLAFAAHRIGVENIAMILWWIAQY